MKAKKTISVILRNKHNKGMLDSVSEKVDERYSQAGGRETTMRDFLLRRDLHKIIGV